MRKTIPAVFAIGVAVWASLSVSHGADKYVGTIETAAANVSKSNSTTSASFELTKGGRYMVQCNVESCVASAKSGAQLFRCAGYADPGDGGSEWLGGADAGVATRVGQKMIYDLTLAASDEFISVVATTGATICDVYAVTP